MRRLAVTIDQVLYAAGGGLQPAPGKTTEPRWRAFAERRGLGPAEPVQYEVEAMPPAQLRALVLAGVDQLVDADLLDQAIQREADERDQLRAFLDDWTDRSD